MAYVVSVEFTNRMQYSLNFAQYKKLSGRQQAMFHPQMAWLPFYEYTKKKDLSHEVHKRDRSLTLLSKPVRGRQGNYPALIVLECS